MRSSPPVYSVNNSPFHVALAAGLGLGGYFLSELGCPPTPLIFILGPVLEVNFRRALLISQGDFSVFVERPISLGFLLLALFLLVLPFYRAWRAARL